MKDCIPWVRARKDDQKEQRIDTILKAAADLFEQHRFDEITFVMIGKQASFTRSNLYRYFKTKEEVFLQLLMHDLTAWRAEVECLLLQNDVKDLFFPQQWLDVVLKHSRLLRLFSILNTLLEHNVSDEAFIEFKKVSHSEIAKIGKVLVEGAWFAEEENASKFIITQSQILSGLNTMCHMPTQKVTLMNTLGIDYDPAYYRNLMLESVQALFDKYS